MMIGCMGAYRERQPVAIHNRQDLDALVVFGDPTAPPFGTANVASMKLSRSSIVPSSGSVFDNFVRITRTSRRHHC